MKNVLKYIVIMFILPMIISCEQEDPKIGRTAVQEVCGHWKVTLYDATGATALTNEFVVITSSTADNSSTEILFWDKGELFDPDLKVKIPCDVTAKTFGSEDEVTSLTDEQTKVIIKDGTITDGYTDQPSGEKGTVTQGVTFTLIDVGDNNTEYKIKGYKYTGWEEDGI